jgi:hypothetical protein
VLAISVAEIKRFMDLVLSSAALHQRRWRRQ